MPSPRPRHGTPDNPAPSLWTLGGLTLTQLLKRTLLASWHDDVYGQGGRMAFYQFLAIFPALFVCLAVCARIPALKPHLNASFRDVSNHLFPIRVSELFRTILKEFNPIRHLGLELASLSAACLWAAHNGTWSIIYGLNRAYEVEENRSLLKLSATIVGLTLWFVLIAVIGLLAILGATNLNLRFHGTGLLLHLFEWLVLIASLSTSLGVLYRFAPNLRDQRWRWSTPGALCALLLWIAGILLTRLYFNHITDYTRTYGHLNRVVMLLLWLYVSNGAILIGGEMNSEIQKAEAHRSHSVR